MNAVKTTFAAVAAIPIAMAAAVAALLIATAAPAPAPAQEAAGVDHALIVGNRDYARGARIAAAGAVLDAVPALESAGFRVVEGADLTASALRTRLSGFLASVTEGARPDGAGPDGAGRVVIVLAGHFARSGGATWFLGSDARAPDLAQVSAEGLALSVVLEVAAQAPGGAVVALGSEERAITLGAGLSPGIRLPDVPQGVTLVVGEAREIAAFVRTDLPRRGQSLATMLAGRPGLSASGFLSPLVAFRPAAGAAAGGIAPPDPRAAERALWEAAQALDSVAGYERYLDRYPRGLFAADARAAIDAIRDEPTRAARLTEEALGLSRDARRAVQRDLTMLGFDTRGVDGIFGPGTRGALTAWQGRNGVAPSGFLTRETIARIAAQADRRAAEIEEEEAARRAAREREDRAFWQDTGAAGDEAGLRAYLRRYPDGVFADVAQTRLRAYEDAGREMAAERERAAWARADAAHTVEGYRAYLRDWPQGANAAEARARIDRAGADRAAIDAAARQEAALGLSQFTRQVIEQRLAAMGFDPGPVDGGFDAATRRALRGYQQARGMPMTGHVTQPLLVQIMADALPLPGR